MSEARELMRRVVVAGDGQLGVLAAIALKRAYPACEVVVIGAPPDPAAMADRMPTALPFTNKLHDRLGIDEERLVREAGASHRLIVRYRGWGGPEQEGTAPYGAATDPRLRTGFARAWGIGPRNESATPPPGSLAEVLAARRDGYDQPWRAPGLARATDITDSPEHLRAVQEGMEATIHGRGTATALARGAEYRMAGKTGTAQRVGRRGDARTDPRSLPYHLRHQALFIGYAPAENPSIAVAVIVEHGGYGGVTAAPIARRIFDAWLLEPEEPQRPVAEVDGEEAGAPATAAGEARSRCGSEIQA